MEAAVSCDERRQPQFVRPREVGVGQQLERKPQTLSRFALLFGVLARDAEDSGDPRGALGRRDGRESHMTRACTRGRRGWHPSRRVAARRAVRSSGRRTRL